MGEAVHGGSAIRPPAIADLPPFEGLPPAVVARLAEEMAWLTLPGGQLLFKRGEPADALYVVASGTVGVLAETTERGQQLVAEIRAGETVGEMALLCGEPHSASVVALQQSELLAMPKAVFDRLTAEEPGFLGWLTRLLVRRLHRTTESGHVAAPYGAVALIPVDAAVPCEEVANRLVAALKDGGFRVHRFEAQAIEQPVEWFDELESAYDLVIYQSGPIDGGFDAWSRFCLGQADRIVLVARPESRLPDPLPALPPGKADRQQPPIDLAVVATAGGTGTASSPERPERFGLLHHLRLEVPEDMARLARHLAGAAVGVVLAGGAARGFAHIGALKALREAGMPVDRIGGTSMGAIVAAGVAIGWGDRELKERMHQAFVESNPLDDYTIPWVALFRGESVDRALRHHFGEAAIESLWRPFFCISTNLTRGGLKVHRHGSLWRALRASVAIPGVLPPVLEADEVLVDGGVVDNFPVDVMAGLGRGPIVGIDVAGDLALTPGSEIPLNRHGLIGLIRPKRGRFPGIVSILSRVGTVSSQLQKAVARAQVDLLVEPSLNEVPLLDWRSFERAIEAGYRAAAAALEQADRRGLELRGLQI